MTQIQAQVYTRGAQRADRRETKPRTYEVGRKCEREGCETILHRYNKQRTCFCHTEGRGRARGVSR